MIRVLQDWQEIGEASRFFSVNDLPRHGSIEKCWDLRLLYDMVAPLGRGSRIIDLGCSGAHTLGFLQAMGFADLVGVDLNVGARDRLAQGWRMWRERRWRRPFRILRRDLTQTGLGGGTFDAATCISVIEHGVDFEAFLRESSRLLKPGGLLLVSADYWEEKMDVSDDGGEYGMAWTILCKQDIEHLVELAGRCGFELLGDSAIPRCGQRCVIWHGREFTFVALAFRKGSQIGGG